MIFTLGVRFHKLKIREMDPIPKAIVKFPKLNQEGFFVNSTSQFCFLVQRCNGAVPTISK
jgi:hypothetical protein